MSKEKSVSTRREFIAKTSIAGAGMAAGMKNIFTSPELSADQKDKIINKTLLVEPRYHRWHVDPGVEWLEVNTSYNSLKWKIPLSQSALVLLDVWQRHFLKDTEARGEEKIQNKLVPLLTTCRKSGMPIIHAPSPSVAMKNPSSTHDTLAQTNGAILFLEMFGHFSVTSEDVTSGFSA